MSTNYCVYDTHNYDYPVPVAYFHTYSEAVEWIEEQSNPDNYEIVESRN